MRTADVMLSFPALLFLLVLVTGAGTSKAVLVLGVALVQMPLIARIVRAATLEQSVRGFVEAAVARGSARPRSSGARSSRTSPARSQPTSACASPTRSSSSPP